MEKVRKKRDRGVGWWIWEVGAEYCQTIKCESFQKSAQPRWKGKAWPHGISKLSPAGWKRLKQCAKVSARAKWCLQGTLFRHAAYGAPHPIHALSLPSMLYLLWCWITAKKTSQFFGCAPYSTYSVTYIVFNVEKIIFEWGDVLVTGVLPPPSIFLAKSNSGACYLPSCTSSW